MRLIDADALIDVVDGYLTDSVEEGKCIEKIMDAPTIDAVPVIRCKDCKWWDEKDDGPYGYCMAMKHGYFSSNWEIGIYRTYKGDWFCADGERKEDGTD